MIEPSLPAGGLDAPRAPAPEACRCMHKADGELAKNHRCPHCGGLLQPPVDARPT